MNINQIVHKARLEGVYAVLRKVQAAHDTFETRCSGSGNCCKIGLVIPLGEAYNIATELRRQYFLLAEDKGQDVADIWWMIKIDELVNALFDETWDAETHEQDGHCVFASADEGCTIYEFRPMVCRAYGVIAPVQDGVCPRKRLPDGGHELIWDDSITKTMNEFDSIVAKWGEDNSHLDFSMYMPAGVLKFLLSEEELMNLISQTDERFWLGAKGYKHQIRQENWQNVEIKSR